ncbi:MAG: hypothetical protein IKZ82_05655 [Clostridia bacterium]|nr:hypothetical protein [Clostridia bacterium]
MKRSFVIDVGSSKVSFLDASASGGALVINKFETCPYAGYSLGHLPNAVSLSEAVEELLSRVSQRFELRARTVSLGVPAPFIESLTSSFEVKTPSGRVTENDLDYLIECAEEVDAPEGFVPMHTTPYEYSINGLACGGSPIGLHSTKLSAGFCHAFADERFVSLISEAVDSAGWRTGSLISIPMACASFTIPFNARLSGAILIDCGASHCDVSAIKGNAVIRTESFGIGGAHFANDIAYGFELSTAVADELKRAYCFGLDYSNTSESVRVPSDASLYIDPADLQLIVEARADEFADRLLYALDSFSSVIPAGAPVYLVGGGMSDMRGCIDFLSRRIGRSIIANAPKAGKLSGIRHAPTLALAHFMLYDGDIIERGYGALESGANRVLGGVKEFFNMGAVARKK